MSESESESEIARGWMSGIELLHGVILEGMGKRMRREERKRGEG